ncbi:MAG: DUF1127 domain-containing protein [Acetobacteraceae bacterium]|nr:DUF1127 domain-containing protein [Acetobacteraceae bacterium]
MSARTSPLPASLRLPAATAVTGWTGWLVRCWRNWETRRGLAELDDHLLKDLGLTREQAMLESDKLPWR